jgi:hypothetical protein
MKIAAIGLAAVVALASGTALADPRQDLVDGMAKCAQVSANDARLACYDALNPAVKAAQAEPVAPPAPPAVAAAPSPAAAPPADTRAWYDPGRIFGVSPREQTTPQQFGSENLEAPPPPPGAPAAPQNAPPPALDSITAGVTDYSFNPYDKFIVVLDNGQIWQQLESDSGAKARFSKGGKNTVVISRGLIGSYNLTINDGPTFKVKRLK